MDRVERGWKLKVGGGMKDTTNRFENKMEGVVVQWIFFRILYFNNDMENMQNVNLNHVF